MLEGLGITADQFIDVCILCGCDYCGTIRGAPTPSASHLAGLLSGLPPAAALCNTALTSAIVHVQAVTVMQLLLARSLALCTTAVSSAILMYRFQPASTE